MINPQMTQIMLYDEHNPPVFPWSEQVLVMSGNIPYN